jgi:hypothetical protein
VGVRVCIAMIQNHQNSDVCMSVCVCVRAKIVTLKKMEVYQPQKFIHETLRKRYILRETQSSVEKVSNALISAPLVIRFRPFSCKIRHFDPDQETEKLASNVGLRIRKVFDLALKF